MIIDTNIDVTPYLATLKGAGVGSIFGYLDPIGPANPKQVTPARARVIAAAGLRLGLVSEGWGDFAHGGISAGAGERDGAYAAKVAPTLGIADGACIYFAVDTDATATQIQKLVLPYFAAIRPAMGTKWKIGVYGSGNVCAAVLKAQYAELAWLSCSTGWGGSRDFLASNQWALHQHPPSSVAGVSCDVDDAAPGVDVGDFVPFVVSPSIIPASPTAAPLPQQTATPTLEALIAEIGALIRSGSA